MNERQVKVRALEDRNAELSKEILLNEVLSMKPKKK